MATTRVAVTFISVRDAKPSYSYENPQYPPLRHTHARVLVRASLPSLPKGSVITGATLRVNQYKDTWSGTNTLFMQRNFAAWTNKATWANMPSLGDTVHSTAKTGSTAGTWWDIDVTSDVQGFYGHTKNNWGWALYTTSTTQRLVRGSTAPTSKPFLVIEYEPPAKTPTGLSPQGGAVSVAAPVLTFNTEGETTAIQVQVDAAQDTVSPDFDSGTVAATSGVLDLDDTAYAGLADGATTSWRARQQTAAGWSAWSPWVSFSRVDLDAVTLTAPAATVADLTPPVAWTFAGTQAAWQAQQIDVATGTVVADSGRVSGTDTSWTPTIQPNQIFESIPSGAFSGYEGRTRVRIWDDVVRIATPGIPAYSEDTADWTVAFDGTVDPMDTLVASQDYPSPGVVLSGTRSEGIPDEVAVLHDGVLVARLEGADVFTTSTTFEFIDWYAEMNREVEITVVAVVNSEFADDSPSVTVTPICSGLWLADPATDEAVVLWGTDQGTWNKGDIAAVHQLTDGSVVRRRLASGQKSGALSGVILDAQGVEPEDVLDTFETFDDNDASTIYRLIAGRLNLAVIAGNFLTTPTPTEGREVASNGQFDWWVA